MTSNLDEEIKALRARYGEFLARSEAVLTPLNESLQVDADAAWAEATKPWIVEKGWARAISEYRVPYVVYTLGRRGWCETPEGANCNPMWLRTVSEVAEAAEEMRFDLIKAMARPVLSDGDRNIYMHDTIVLRRPYEIAAAYDAMGGGLLLKATVRLHYWNSADPRP